MEKISEIIRRELINQPDSLRTLAERCEVDHTQLSRFMRGERGLSISAVDSICKALGLTLCVLPKKGRRR